MIDLDAMSPAELDAFIDSRKKFPNMRAFALSIFPSGPTTNRFSYFKAANTLLALARIRRYHWGANVSKEWKRKYADLYNSLPKSERYPHRSL